MTLEDMIASVPRAEIVEDLRLDADAEDFSVVSRVGVGPDGQILVPLNQDGQLRIYDASGEELARVGRRGGGPGEFESLALLGFVADTAWVFDIRQPRVTYIDTRGSVLRTLSLPQRALLDTTGTSLGSMIMFAPFAIFDDGTMVGETRAGNMRSGGGIGPRALALRPLDGDARLLFYPASYEDPRWMMEIEGFGQPVPFVMLPQLGWSPNGHRIVTLHTDSITERGGVLKLEIYELGDVRSALSATSAMRPVTSTPIRYAGDVISKHDADSALAEFIPQAGEGTEGPANLPKRFQDAARERMPSRYPPVVRLRHGVDETIWLDLRPTSEGKPSLILDLTGKPVATVVVPHNVTISQSDRNHIWGVARDENGLGSVVRYRIAG